MVIFIRKNHYELPSIFKLFYKEVEVQYGYRIFTFCSDNAQKYIQTNLPEFCTSHGIIHQTSCAHIPQQNGIAEHKNRHLFDIARTLVFHREK